jgi:hypothetical protein
MGYGPLSPGLVRTPDRANFPPSPRGIATKREEALGGPLERSFRAGGSEKAGPLHQGPVKSPASLRSQRLRGTLSDIGRRFTRHGEAKASSYRTLRRDRRPARVGGRGGALSKSSLESESRTQGSLGVGGRRPPRRLPSRRRPGVLHESLHEGFDPGSELTLAAWLRHASRTAKAARPCKWRKGE